MNLLLEIITPEKVVYKDEVNEVIAPTINGEIAILPNHIGLLTQVNPGELIIKKGTTAQYLAITGGFLEVENNKISILADYAVKAQDIEVARATEAKKRAEKIMSEKATDNELRIAQAEMIKAILELKVATKHKRRAI
ncbi:MAG: F0F1 ATP synthase subunit epsilon [Candidatus Levybacteria bacterium]|nr:F0F1 ATP synthase subunit epsilon [Candidatus Levybacteria bacterium]